jgi:GTPase
MGHSMETDEDRQIERLLIHRNLVGWVIERLEDVGIEAMRTIGNDENGDIRLLQPEDVVQAKVVLRSLQQELDGTVREGRSQMGDNVYIEIKAYSTTTVTSTLVRRLIQKSTVMGVVTTAGITKPAKELLDQADIAWVERFPEAYLGGL